MEREKALDRIQALFATAESTQSQAEAETAMRIAQKIMLEHNLSTVEINQAEIDREWACVDVWSGSRRPPEAKYVADIVARFFFVKVLYDNRGPTSNTLRFFGAIENTAMGRHVYMFLSRVFPELWRRYAKLRPYAKLKYRHGYYMGLRAGIYATLEQSQEQITGQSEACQNGLIAMRRDLDAAKDRLFPEFSIAIRNKPQKANKAAFLAGVIDGEEIKINRPLPAPSSQLRIEDTGHI